MDPIYEIELQDCPYCRGTGTVRTQQNFMGMTMQSSQPCPQCGGTGTIITDPCTACRGKGKGRHTKTVRVKVPAGIDDGQSFRVRDEGNAGSNGGPNGDLLVTVSVRKHPIFTRDGANVMCQMPISFTQAALGASIEVPTLDGKVRYQIPEGTQTGTTFRLRGKGIPYVGYKTRGDQFVTVVVETPTRLTREQKELLRQLKARSGLEYQASSLDLGMLSGDPAEVPVLLISGGRRISFTPEERAKLRKYLLDGGMIWFDSVVGSPFFLRSAAEELRRILPEAPHTAQKQKTAEQQ